jgi:hypothetical protein
VKGNRYERYWSYALDCNHRCGAAAARLVSGATRHRANGLSRARTIASLAVATPAKGLD